MRYADTLLADGEVIIMRRRQHWLALLLEGRAAVALWLVAIALLAAVWFFDLSGQPAQVVSIVALVCLGIGLLLFAWRYWQWWAQDYIVTNRRLLKVTGIFNKHASSSSLEKINDAILDHNLVGRLLNYGDIDILTASGELAVDYFRMLHSAKEFKRVLTTQKHALEMEYRFDQAPSPPLRAPMNIIGEPASPAPPPPAVETATDTNEPALGAVPAAEAIEPPAADGSLEITQTLARLADLRDRGAISAEEYAAKKDELLRRL
jgi:hypothetical protein